MGKNVNKNKKATNYRRNSNSFNANKGSNGKKQDPLWYAENEAAIKHMGSLAWNSVVGAPITDDVADVVPGFVAYPYVTTCGSSQATGAADTITRAADAYYQYATQGFTGGVDFEAPDLFMTAVAGADLGALIEEGRRVLGLMDIAADTNNYYPKGIIIGLGWDYDALMNVRTEEGEKYTRTDFIADINIRINQFNKIVALPKDFPLYHRWKFLAEHIFSDNDQPVYNTLFAPVKAGVLYYDGTSLETGTCLRSRGLKRNYIPRLENESPMTWDKFLEIVDFCLDQLTDDDVRNIFGALRRVYSPDWFVKIDKMDISYETPVVRNDVVSAMYHNADYFSTVVGLYQAVEEGTDTLDDDEDRIFVWQNSRGDIIARLAAMHTADDAELGIFPKVTEHLLDTWEVDPTPGSVLDITAGMVPYAKPRKVVSISGAAGEFDFVEIIPRAEVNLRPKVYYRSTTSESEDIEASYVLPFVIKNTSNASFDSFFSKPMILFTHMNSHPLIKVVTPLSVDTNPVGSNSVECTIDSLIGEIDRYTVISEAALRRMHSRSYYTLFALPENTKSVTK